MADDSNFIRPIGFAIIIYILIGLAPLLFEQPSVFYPSHTSLIEHQMKSIEGLLHPLDHPAATIFSLAGGTLLAYLKNKG